jgi:hypothetical protein
MRQPCFANTAFAAEAAAAAASKGTQLRIEIGRQALRSAERAAGWRATTDSDDHYVYAIAL